MTPLPRVGRAGPHPAQRRPIQQPESVLAVVMRVGAKLVQHSLFRSPVGLMITGRTPPETLPYALPSHPNPPSAASLGYLADRLTA